MHTHKHTHTKTHTNTRVRARTHTHTRTGDVLEKIDDQDVSRLDAASVRHLLRGPPGSEVLINHTPYTLNPQPYTLHPTP